MGVFVWLQKPQKFLPQKKKSLLSHLHFNVLNCFSTGSEEGFLILLFLLPAVGIEGKSEGSEGRGIDFALVSVCLSDHLQSFSRVTE